MVKVSCRLIMWETRQPLQSRRVKRTQLYRQRKQQLMSLRSRSQLWDMQRMAAPPTAAARAREEM